MGIDICLSTYSVGWYVGKATIYIKMTTWGQPKLQSDTNPSEERNRLYPSTFHLSRIVAKNCVLRDNYLYL